MLRASSLVDAFTTRHSKFNARVLRFRRTSASARAPVVSADLWGPPLHISDRRTTLGPELATRGVDGCLVSEYTNPRDILERAVHAMNSHDLDALVACFHPEYESIQPVHPRRSFRGREHVVQNWEWVFDRFPDFHAELVDCLIDDRTAWTEWRWTGTDIDGEEVEVRGVMILMVAGDMIRSGRLYLEPVTDS